MRVRLRTRASTICAPAISALAVWTAVVSGPALAASQETRLKAAFLYNFAKHVEWPADAFEDGSQAIRFCVVGDDELAASFAELTEGKSVRGRPVAGETLPLSAPADRLAGCQVLFLDEDLVARSGDAFTRGLPGPILTVSDDEDFARNGGVLNFRRSGSRPELDINRREAERRRLSVGARLLQLATLVDSDS